MIRGVTVNVLRPGAPELDRLGNEVPSEPSEEAVEDVLVSPGATKDLEAARPEGVTVAYTLHFPKTYQNDLEGCLVQLPGPWLGTYRVVGKPGPYIGANTPTRWHMPVEVEAAHG